jgi:hypothetical protein
MVAVPMGGPLGSAAGVLDDVAACVVVIGELLAATGLPAVVLHAVAASATTAAPIAERVAILAAYVARIQREYVLCDVQAFGRQPLGCYRECVLGGVRASTVLAK